MMTPEEVKIELETLVWKVLNNERRDWDGCLDQYTKWIEETVKKLAQLAKDVCPEKKEKGVNWSNCPIYGECKDGMKHILTYCDVSCSNPCKGTGKEQDPELREKIAKMGFEFLGIGWDKLTEPSKEMFREKADQILALYGDVKKPLVEALDTFINLTSWTNREKLLAIKGIVDELKGE